EPVSIVQINLMTGRFHQIRAQFSHFGFPLLGDRRYGSSESNDFSEREGIRNVALCACSLSFIHPSTGKVMEFEIEPENKYLMIN
nr:RluA family pseudouridine synthase [Butyrivibrio sp.]